MKSKGKKSLVFVGVSGGVDSSVSAALLQKAGYEVVGVFIRTWTPDFIDCTWRAERRDAMRVCAALDIPFLECDAEEAYKKNVADYMISEYRGGRTPNPDVMCNREVKFGVFYDFAMKRGADFVATGHYAQISGKGPALRSQKGRSLRRNLRELQITPARLNNRSGGNYELRKGNDSGKDQSYFLWTLSQEKLAHTLFPIGHLKKPEVRKLAKKFDLPTASKKDSQGVCFLGPLDMKDFLKHYIKSKPGVVLDENSEIIGSHDGAVFLTLGERHGFTITKKSASDSPYYVAAKDVKKNTVTVSHKAQTNTATSADEGAKAISIKECNWISVEPVAGKKYKAQIRYHGEYIPVETEEIKNTSVTLKFKSSMLVAPGQSIVLYDGDMCMGGGVVA